MKRLTSGVLIAFTGVALLLAAGCGDSDNNVQCGEGTQLVDDECVPLSTTTCGEDTVEMDGVCVATCPSGFDDCSGICVDQARDRDNCGACGTRCGDGEVCNAGACELQCQDGLTDCAGVCVNTASDRGNCGGCGVTCADGEVCGAEGCTLSCQAGRTDCAGACVDSLTDEANCGMCGVSCLAGESCVAGVCAVVCAAGQVDCNGTCIDPTINPNFCGASADCAGPNAGEVCRADQLCNTGACACPAAYTACPGVCVNTVTDYFNCGGCGVTCGVNESCVNSGCVVNLTYAGSLPPANGRWSYGGAIGLPGADAFCATNFPGTSTCTQAQLQAAAANSELIGATDINSNPVTSFWLEDPGANNNRRCFDTGAENLPWDYATAHFGLFGNFASLNNGTGVLSAPAVSSCGTAHAVACCH